MNEERVTAPEKETSDSYSKSVKNINNVLGSRFFYLYIEIAYFEAHWYTVINVKENVELRFYK